MIPKDGDTPPLLHVGKLTTGAKHSAGPNIPVWKKHETCTHGVFQVLFKDVPCSKAYHSKQKKQNQIVAKRTRLLYKSCGTGGNMTNHVFEKCYSATVNLEQEIFQDRLSERSRPQDIIWNMILLHRVKNTCNIHSTHGIEERNTY